MNLSRLFIYRPVATSLLAIGLVLTGIVGFKLLPVASLPQVDFPTISVTAQQAGASPETMAATVATPLERSLGQIAGVTEMTSNSSSGRTNVVLQFDLDRDIDGAAREVQAAINAALPLLPTGLSSRPSYRKVNPADQPIVILAMTSDTLSMGQVYDVADTILGQRLAQVEGIGQVNIGGAAKPAVRVELNPTVLNKLGIDIETVRTAITSSNANRPKGFVSNGKNSWQIYADDQTRTAAQYRPLIVAYKNGAPIRLGDVAEVSDSVENVRNAGYLNGKKSVSIQLFRQPNANIIETVDRIKALMPILQASIPSGIDLIVANDRSKTIRSSLKEVEKTLMISVALVILVVFLFLRNGRATWVPAVAVPVSLMGTFGVMYLVGFSLNNLSLMALTVATGFVVDDAIVVLENITRHVENGMTPFKATLQGTREVGFTVLSMSLSLIAVFIPVLLMGGVIGRLLREFAITLSISILISMVVSLTLTPMMCARLLRRHKTEAEAGNATSAPVNSYGFWSRLKSRLAWPTRKLQQGSLWLTDGMARGYERSLKWALRFSPVMIVILAATIALNIYLYTIVPKGLFPQQDNGQLIGFVQADQSSSFQSMKPKMEEFMRIVQTDPAVENIVAFTSGGARAQLFVILKPLADRPGHVSADQVINRIRPKTAKIAGGSLNMQATQDIRIGGRQSDSQYQFTLQADEVELLRTWEKKIRLALGDLDEITDVNTDTQERGLQTYIHIDREAAARLGITVRQIDTTLNNLFGQRQVSTIYNDQNQYKVVMEAAPQYWQSPETLKNVYVSSSSGAIVPLSAFSRFEPTTTTLGVNHQGQFVASTISFNLSEGVSLSQATDAINNAMSRIGVPNSVHGVFAGTANVFQKTLQSQPMLILVALLAVYIVLGVLYESLIHPLTIISTLPSAGVGALLALLLTGTQFTIIAFIAVILLIGIVKKNAIMMIDFAISAERERGLDPRDAIFEACKLRFRPIMMTTMAALLGAVPLIVATGEGVELRQPLGIAIVGGLILSQLLTLYTTPVVYVYMDRFQSWTRRMRKRFQTRHATSLAIEES